MKKTIIPFILLLSICAIIYLISNSTQSSIQFNNGLGWDGVSYSGLVSFFQGKTVDCISSPFHNRPVIPYIISFLNSDVITAFKLINILFLVGFLFFYVKTAEILNINTGMIILSSGWLMLHWMGIIRFYIFYPVSIDTGLYFTQIIFLYLVISRRYYALLILAPFLALTKESFIVLYIIITLIAVFLFIKKQIPKKAVIILTAASIITITAKYISNTWIITYSVGETSLFGTAISVIISHRIRNPFEIIRFVAAFFSGYGFLLLLLIVGLKKNFSIQKKEDYYLFIMFLLSLAFGLFGGLDMTRILLNSFPFISLFILSKTKALSKITIISSVIFTLPLLRIFSRIPEPIIKDASAFNEKTGYFSWFMELTDLSIVATMMVYMILCLLALMIIDSRSKELEKYMTMEYWKNIFK